MRVRIGQMLCPARHCVFALASAVPPAELSDADLARGIHVIVDRLLTGRAVQELAALGVRDQHLEAWCGICGAAAGTWALEVAWSIDFPDWATAEAALREVQAAHRETRAVRDLLDLTYTKKPQ